MGVKCILFDLDGTLVSTGGAGARALEDAFFSIYKVRHAMEKVNPAGKTDPAIIREIFHLNFQRDCDSVEMQCVQQKYLEFLPEECRKADDYEVMPQIPELLVRLEKLNVAMGLGTGNLERGARIKLDRSGLNGYLPFGGFGSDSEVRADLLKAGHEKASRFAKKTIDPSDVWVVGDTERDILAARAAQFKVIAVATGNSSEAFLMSHRPDHCLVDFKETDRFIDIIFS